MMMNLFVFRRMLPGGAWTAVIPYMTKPVSKIYPILYFGLSVRCPMGTRIDDRWSLCWFRGGVVLGVSALGFLRFRMHGICDNGGGGGFFGVVGWVYDCVRVCRVAASRPLVDFYSLASITRLAGVI